ncbi:DUF3560 domain-containing protein [Streptomyces syringium]|uniref:DUF3560 domain-containing protein n=1 Tax=Streptomyces syringium TaxID=76729 RepID=UPI0037D1AFFE
MTETPAKGAITITHTRAEGTILNGSRKGDGIFEIVRKHGFWFSGHVTGLFLKQSRDKEADTWRINRAADALRAAGHEVTIEIDDEEHRSFEEIEAELEERAADRADRFSERAGRAVASADARRATADRISKRFEFGQPILVGHHSEGPARRAAARIGTNMQKSFEDRDRAGYWANRAEASENYAKHRKDPYRTLRRLERLGAALRQQERHHAEAVEKGWDSAERHARQIRDLKRDIAGWEEIVKKAEEDGVKVWRPEDFAPRDFVLCSGSWYQIARVNPKTLSIAWNLRLAPKQVMTLEDATFDGGRVGTHTADYTNARARCPEAAMLAFLADGKVPGTKLAHAASKEQPASAVREAQAAAKSKPKPKKKGSSDPKVAKRIYVACPLGGAEATLTWLNGNSRPHKDFKPVKITPPEGEKFHRAVWSRSLQAEIEKILGEQGYVCGERDWAVSPDRSGFVRPIQPKQPEEPPMEADEQQAPESASKEQAPAAETCPMCRSSQWDPKARFCSHCHHNPKATPTSAVDPEGWQEAMAMVFIVSKNTRRARKRALWAMTRREAQAVCGDPRTSGRSYMLTWSDRPGDEGADWEWVPDNGSLDAVLEDLGITPRREWTAPRDAVVTATA